MNFFLSRYLFYSILALETVALPQLLPKASYASLEYFKYLLGFSTVVLLGSHTGLLINHYTSKIRSAVPLFRAAFILSFSIGFIFSVHLRNPLVAFVITLSVLTPILEKVLQINSKFILSVLFKPLLSLSTLLFVFLLRFHILPKIDMLSLLSLAYILAFFAWLLFFMPLLSYSTVQKFSLARWLLPNSDFKVFARLSRLGFSDNLGTIVLFAYFFVDRFVISKYYTSLLPAYSLGFNLSQFAFLGLSSLAFTSTVYVGERLSSFGTKKASQLFRTSIFLFICLFLLSVVASSLYSAVNTSYGNLVSLTVIITLGCGVFYAANVLSPLVLYRGYQSYITIALAGAFLVNIVLSYFFVHYNVNPQILILKSGLLLSCVGVFIASLAFKLASP
jgi:Na+-driven multidrug efflux pump